MSLPIIRAPNKRLPLEPLTHQSFAQFGTVTDNPNTSGPRPGIPKKIANQGTCQRWFDITNLTDYYSSAPSGTPAKPSVSFAICEPRRTRDAGGSIGSGGIGEKRFLPGAGTDVHVEALPRVSEEVYDVEVLERHPFTSQTFIPMGLARDDPTVYYIVIVAPTLPSNTSTSSSSISTTAPLRPDGALADDPKGRGPPDLENIRAFVARGDQAVTYGAGTWHAPMAVIGGKSIEFVIVQNANGVAAEDCEEVELRCEGGGDEEGVCVVLLGRENSVQVSRARL